MDGKQSTDMIIELNQKTSMILERLNGMSNVCRERRDLIQNHEQRIAKLEKFMQREETYRKMILGMLTGLFALVTWATSAIPKLLGWFQ